MSNREKAITSAISPEFIDRRGDTIHRIQDFCELHGAVRVGPLPEAMSLIAWLNMDCVQLEYDGSIIEVAASKAHLTFSLSGLDADLDRFGMKALEPAQSFKENTKQTIEGKASGSAKGGFSLSPLGGVPTAAAQAVVGGQASTKIERTKRREITEHRVISRPGCRWEFVEPGGGRLDGQYLAETRLCRLIPKAGANRVEVSGELVVFERDLHFSPAIGKFPFGKGRNREKLMKIFIAKYLAGLNEERFAGRISLASIEIEL